MHEHVSWCTAEKLHLVHCVPVQTCQKSMSAHQDCLGLPAQMCCTPCEHRFPGHKVCFGIGWNESGGNEPFTCLPSSTPSFSHTTYYSSLSV